MGSKKDFVSLLEKSHDFIGNPDGPVKSEKVIKNNPDKSPRSIEQIRWEEVSGRQPEINIVENNGRVERIEFKCKCGCGASVNIDYE